MSQNTARQDRADQSFSAKIKQEFITGSAIAPELYAAAIEIHADTEPSPGGEVCYPIHAALNWNLSRFGYQARPDLEAAFLINDDGSLWQAKLSHPLQDRKQGKPRKYESPAGGGSKPYLPPIPYTVWQKICDRHHLPYPHGNSNNGNSKLQSTNTAASLRPSEVAPRVLEMGRAPSQLARDPHRRRQKGTLCLLSLGCTSPSALYGVNGGYRTKDRLGAPNRTPTHP